MTFPYSRQNAESRKRLESLVHSLSDADLACSTDYGWTVAALLAHLAFWDQRMSVILKRWQTEGPDPSEIDSTAVNDALKVLCHALERVSQRSWRSRPQRRSTWSSKPCRQNM
jgi:hypothetical protein